MNDILEVNAQVSRAVNKDFVLFVKPTLILNLQRAINSFTYWNIEFKIVNLVSTYEIVELAIQPFDYIIFRPFTTFALKLIHGHFFIIIEIPS